MSSLKCSYLLKFDIFYRSTVSRLILHVLFTVLTMYSWVHTCMEYNDLVYSVITKTLRVCIWSGSHVHSNLTVLRRK